jgi:hypothetical protein
MIHLSRLSPVLLALAPLVACADADRAHVPPVGVQQIASQQTARVTEIAVPSRPERTAQQRRIRQTVNEPLVLGPPPPPPAASDGPAPLPNRDIEAPRERYVNNLNPKIEPMVLQPERRQGMTFGREHLRETGPDRPFDTILPGARLRIPFE